MEFTEIVYCVEGFTETRGIRLKAWMSQKNAWNSRKGRGIHRDGVEFALWHGIGRRGLGDVGRSGAPAGVVPEVAITPGMAARPAARGGGGDAPRAAQPQGQPEVGAPRVNCWGGGANQNRQNHLIQQAKISRQIDHQKS